MFVRCVRRWPNIESALGEFLDSPNSPADARRCSIACQMLAQFWANVGSPSSTLGQHKSKLGECLVSLRTWSAPTGTNLKYFSIINLIVCWNHLYLLFIRSVCSINFFKQLLAQCEVVITRKLNTLTQWLFNVFDDDPTFKQYCVCSRCGWEED